MRKILTVVLACLAIVAFSPPASASHTLFASQGKDYAWWSSSTPRKVGIVDKECDGHFVRVKYYTRSDIGSTEYGPYFTRDTTCNSTGVEVTNTNIVTQFRVQEIDDQDGLIASGPITYTSLDA